MEKTFRLKSILLAILGLGIVIPLLFFSYRDWQSSKIWLENSSPAAVAKSSTVPQASVIFTGDIMLDRGVEYQIKKHQDWFYPFEKISNYLHQSNVAIGNLEGPIVKNPPYFSDKSLKFAFSPEVVPSLAKANFQILSLANNHTDNMGREGFRETKEFLTKQNIKPVGHYLTCNPDDIVTKGSLVIWAFNKTFPNNCSAGQITAAVKTIRQRYPLKFLIVIPHWGQEYYRHSSSTQESLAHHIIEAGADLIIGSHPHVVEEVEEYKGKLIFYSLGNFIFDQHFSKDVQEGLTVWLKLYPNQVSYQLFPTNEGMSQPSLQLLKDKKEFLKNLAERSTASLISQIKAGKIILPWKASLPITIDKNSVASKKTSYVFPTEIQMAKKSHLVGQLVKHLYDIKGVPNVKSLIFSPDGQKIWGALLLNKKRGLAVFDPKSGKNLANINLQNGGGVEMAFSPDEKKLYVSQMETGKVFEIDPNIYKILRVFDSGSTWTKVLAISSGGKTLFASNWVGNNVSEIDLRTGKLIKLIPTVKTPRGIYLTKDQHYLYVAGFAHGEIQKIDLETGSSKVLFRSGGAMRHIAADEKRHILFFSDMGKDVIWKLNLLNDQVKEFAKTDHNPNTIVLSPDKKILFVSCRGLNHSATNYYVPGPEWGSVLLFDAQTGRLLDAIVGGNQPTALAISPDGKTLAFSDFLDQKIEFYVIPPYKVLQEGKGGCLNIYKNYLRK